MLDSFQWDESFVTGLHQVDEEHHHLVDVINRFGHMLTDESSPRSESLQSVFDELSAYTSYHFQQEESFMLQVGIDPRYFQAHCELHRNFVAELNQMRATLAPDHADSARQLLRFLTYWLAYHILGTDQSMARQVRAMAAGRTAEQAYLDEKAKREGAMEPLLQALNGLFHQVSQRNRQLQLLNETLEQRVAQRTAELSEANRRLEELALTDVLTGLPNRRHAMRSLGELWQTGSMLACMMIDADGFKQINDQWGHDAGDEVLRQLARALRRPLRTDDLVARLGGDEFLVLLPGTAAQDALRLAEQLRSSVAELRVPAGGGVWLGSISVGVASRSADMSHPEDLIKLADQSVYLAKRGGRNRVASAAVAAAH